MTVGLADRLTKNGPSGATGSAFTGNLLGTHDIDNDITPMGYAQQSHNNGHLGYDSLGRSELTVTWRQMIDRNGDGDSDAQLVANARQERPRPRRRQGQPQVLVGDVASRQQILHAADDVGGICTDRFASQNGSRIGGLI
jgi:hypothetical protein